jgi:hypothetical protein
MTWNILLESGDALLLENGDNLLLESAPSMPNLILFTEESFRPTPPKEETTPFYIAKLEDENGAKLETGILEAFLLRVYVEATEFELRPNQDALNANDVSIAYGAASTDLEWLVQVGDTRLESLLLAKEKHTALFEYSWDAGSTGEITDALDTTLDDETVNINIPTHGLTGTDNHIFLVEPDEVGGLCLGGSHYISEITDSDNIKIEARKVATGTASGGGTFTYYLNSKVLKHKVSFTVGRAEPTLC